MSGNTDEGSKRQLTLIEALTSTYAELVKRQRTASAAFVRWQSPTRRAHEFAWIPVGEEVIIRSGRPLVLEQSSAAFEATHKMAATVELNPFEREILYGYPYVIGYRDGDRIRGPLLTIPVAIDPSGRDLVVTATDDVVRFNSLPFRPPSVTEIQDRILARLIEDVPEYPVADDRLRAICETLSRDFGIEIRANLDGRLVGRPNEPNSGEWLAVVDAAACFVAPKTSYFLASDLADIGRVSDGTHGSAMVALFTDKLAQATSDEFADRRHVYFPFPSNPSQRRVATLTEDLANQVIVVQGPPGTGKSQTVANVACHLVARGKRVLITSQKDQALAVVDALLSSLNMTQLPMTLLRQDRDSRQELRERLMALHKDKPSTETATQNERSESSFKETADTSADSLHRLAVALENEHRVATAAREAAAATSLLLRIKARAHLRRAYRLAKKHAPITSDVLGDKAAEARALLLERADGVLDAAAQHRVSTATKAEAQQLREFAALLGRNQTSYKNFHIFDRLKSEPARCEMLLKILPCWIMSPDDVARLFPCTPGLFDVVIIDEASQCDLPSMVPVLYRAKQAIIAGDSKQMQAQRFAFTSEQVAVQAWHEQGMDRLDPDRWLDPSKTDLLQLANIRRDEEAFLDEHYRSLPPIISFSNAKWYRNRLRVMRDLSDRRVGDPREPIVRVHTVDGASVTPGTQENPVEALELTNYLERLLDDPMYAGATVGILCLFDDQMRLVSELVAERIDEQTRADHSLVVVNPDGFQGDERDVVLYSLSYDAHNMTQAQLSARQADREHIQGMLNVGFTRARDEIHVFISAPVETFGMASGRGAIREWLEYCRDAEKTFLGFGATAVPKADSEFEAEVAQALVAARIRVTPQYESCGFRIDLVAEREGERIAIECDGELWHLDEHGKLRIEDLQRQEILERAGWRVVRIPYRQWRRDPAAQTARVIAALEAREDQDTLADSDDVDPNQAAPERLTLRPYEAAIVGSLKEGAHEREEVFRRARALAGHGRLGPQIRISLEGAVESLSRKGLVVVEDDDIFATDRTKAAAIQVETPIRPRPRTSRPASRRRNSRSYRRRY